MCPAHGGGGVLTANQLGHRGVNEGILSFIVRKQLFHQELVNLLEFGARPRLSFPGEKKKRRLDNPEI